MHDVLQTYLTVSWHMAAVIAAWLLVRLVLRGRVPARILAFGWVIVVAGLVLPWRWPSGLSPFNWMPRPPVMQTDAVFEPDVRLSFTPSLTRAPARSTAGTSVSLPSIALIPVAKLASAPPTAESDHERTSFLYAWLGGVLMLVATRVWRWAQGIRAVARQQPNTSRDLNELISACTRELNISVPVRVYETTTVGTPSICGIRKPILLFPIGFAGQLTAAELRLVLLHELGHWCRRDLWMHELTFLARALHWYNPLVWIAVRLARDDSEAACDEFVLRRVSSRDIPVYGATLLKILSVVRRPAGYPVGLGLFGSKQKLQQRIQMIAHYQRPGAWSTLIGAAAIAALLAVSLSRELHAQNTPPPTFAVGITTVAPTGWWRNGQNAENYTVGVDGTQSHVRPSSAYVRSIGPGTSKDFGGMMQMFDAAEYHGKRLRFSAWMKTQDAAHGAQLWMRIDGRTQGQSLQFDNMDMRPHPKGTADWQFCEVVLDVPAEATAVALGFFIKQTGQAWVNDAKLEVVDSSVPSTNMRTSSGSLRKLPSAPANLEFNSVF